MKVKSFLKKLNKTYSVVIIPNSNDNIRKISIKAPFLKLILVILVLCTAAFFIISNNNQKAADRQALVIEAGKADLKQQVKALRDVINQQSQTLSLTKSQLEQLKSSDNVTKAKIEEFTKMYTRITQDYISKSSRGSSPTKNSSNALLDLTKLSSIIEDLNNHFSSDKKLAAELRESNEKLNKYIDAVPTFFPVSGGISSPFGMRKHPIKKVRIIHEGVDLNASKGDPILAAASGVVEFAGYSNGYGYNVIIDHRNGFRTLYAHSSKLLVKEGDQVKKGQEIALVGSTGLSTAPHLHFEIRIGNTPVDPTQYMDFSFEK